MTTAAGDARWRQAALALGGNLGDRIAILRSALERLATTPGISLVGVSPVFETAPIGGPEQPDFLNAVVIAQTNLAPRQLLECTRAVEEDLGRVRTIRWWPRTIDIDLLVVGDLVVDEPDLTLPHPRATQRAFVVVPWLRADPQARLPGGSLVADVTAHLDVRDVHERTDLTLALPEVESQR